jgi:hypothetical protein
MTSIVFCNARDENYILEWACHYKLLGFDEIYITDHKSVVPICIQIDGVTVVRCEKDTKKCARMIEAVKYAKEKRHKWLFYIDADEFLVLNRHKTVNEFLKSYNNSIQQIGVNWLMFGTNGLFEHPHGKSIMETYLMSNEIVDKHVKCFACVDAIEGTDNPHCYKVKDRSKSMHCDGKLLDNKTPYWFEYNKKPGETVAYLAHYVYQAYNIYLQRKIDLPRDDLLTFRTKELPEVLHSRYNKIITNDLIKMYDTRIKEMQKKIIQIHN